MQKGTPVIIGTQTVGWKRTVSDKKCLSIILVFSFNFNIKLRTSYCITSTQREYLKSSIKQKRNSRRLFCLPSSSSYSFSTVFVVIFSVELVGLLGCCCWFSDACSFFSLLPCQFLYYFVVSKRDGFSAFVATGCVCVFGYIWARVWSKILDAGTLPKLCFL